MNRQGFARSLSILFAGFLAFGAQATTLSVALDVSGQGLSMTEGAVGLEGIGAGSRNLSVNIGGTVQAALLYWAGRDRPCPENPAGTCVIPSQPYKDQVLKLDGTTITGTVIGTEGQPVSASGPINNIGYLADVTSIVQARGTGLQTFSIMDGDPASNLFRMNGATLLVIYTDPASDATCRIIVFDGLDFAFGADPVPGATRVTVPITFNHGAVAGARQGQLIIASGDTQRDRPDRISISNNPDRVNTLDGSDGFSWDSDTLTINIPGGVGSTTVRLFSEPANQNPDSLLWELAALRVCQQEEEPSGEEGCTPGYWKNHTSAWAGTGYSAGQTAGSVFSLGGFPSLANRTLLQTLQGGGGSGTLGAARILLRAAVAALLNAAHAGVDYPRTTTEIIADVNAALASNNRSTMLELAAELDGDNNLGCPLN
jgi:hypothetical protein